jgi:hypothetical protein
MRAAFAFAAALLASGCATMRPGAEQPSAAWLVGTWVLLAPDLEFPLACSSGLPIAYQADGTYRMFEEAGTWRLEGDRLHETPTEAEDPRETRIGETHRNRIVRRGPDEMVKYFADGGSETLRRCSPAQ